MSGAIHGHYFDPGRLVAEVGDTARELLRLAKKHEGEHIAQLSRDEWHGLRVIAHAELKTIREQTQSEKRNAEKP